MDYQSINTTFQTSLHFYSENRLASVKDQKSVDVRFKVSGNRRKAKIGNTLDHLKSELKKKLRLFHSNKEYQGRKKTQLFQETGRNGPNGSRSKCSQEVSVNKIGILIPCSDRLWRLLATQIAQGRMVQC